MRSQRCYDWEYDYNVRYYARPVEEEKEKKKEIEVTWRFKKVKLADGTTRLERVGEGLDEIFKRIRREERIEGLNKPSSSAAASENEGDGGKESDESEWEEEGNPYCHVGPPSVSPLVPDEGRKEASRTETDTREKCRQIQDWICRPRTKFKPEIVFANSFFPTLTPLSPMEELTREMESLTLDDDDDQGIEENSSSATVSDSSESIALGTSKECEDEYCETSEADEDNLSEEFEIISENSDGDVLEELVLSAYWAETGGSSEPHQPESNRESSESANSDPISSMPSYPTSPESQQLSAGLLERSVWERDAETFSLDSRLQESLSPNYTPNVSSPGSGDSEYNTYSPGDIPTTVFRPEEVQLMIDQMTWMAEETGAFSPTELEYFPRAS